MTDKALLSEVCKETIGTWFYDAAEKLYIRFDKNGVINAKIYGRFLPDPELMWTHRIDAYNQSGQLKITRGHPEAQKMKCHPGTYDLWSHWSKVSA